MHKFSFLSFLALLTLAACYRNAPSPNFDMDKVLPQDTMVVLMTEMQLVDGAVGLKSRTGQPVWELSNAYTGMILKKHGIDREIFGESIRYYSFHIEKMDAIYEEVINRLALMESELNKAPTE